MAPLPNRRNAVDASFRNGQEIASDGKGIGTFGESMEQFGVVVSMKDDRNPIRRSLLEARIADNPFCRPPGFPTVFIAVENVPVELLVLTLGFFEVIKKTPGLAVIVTDGRAQIRSPASVPMGQPELSLVGAIQHRRPPRFRSSAGSSMYGRGHIGTCRRPLIEDHVRPCDDGSIEGIGGIRLLMLARGLVRMTTD